VLAEQVDQPDLGAVGVDEAVILLDDRSRRQGLTQFGDARQLAAGLDLLRLKRPAGGAIGVALSRKGRPACQGTVRRLTGCWSIDSEKPR
jgi:hypothetical protein